MNEFVCSIKVCHFVKTTGCRHFHIEFLTFLDALPSVTAYKFLAFLDLLASTL